jgi:hypothetical protein
MKDQHKKIKGYRDLSQEEIDLMNRIKEQGACLEIMCEDLFDLESTDKRWVSMAKTDLQTGIMKAVRAVAKPESF